MRQELSRLQQRATANRLSAAQALQGMLASYVQARRAAAVNPSAAVPAVVLGAGAGMDGGAAGHAETGYMRGSTYQGTCVSPPGFAALLLFIQVSSLLEIRVSL